MKRIDPTILFPVLFLGAIAAAVALMMSCVINDSFATKTVLETYPGSKTVCVAQSYSYSVKHTVCNKYKSVPATCVKTQVAGPLFDTYTNTECN